MYGGEFEDETFAVKHESVGLLGMAKRAEIPHTNGSQFYVTLTAPLTFMDKTYVVFGRVVQGFRMFKIIEKIALKAPEENSTKFLITDSGQYTYSIKKTTP